jgi:hypothetical protein
MSKLFSLILTTCVCLWSAQAAAQQSSAPPQKAKSVKKAAAKPAASAPAHADDLAESEVEGAAASEFHCELGNKITVYRKEADNNSIAVRWLKRLHKLVRVDTTTGADRYENRQVGLVWIGIPAKSMLLDSKKGQQLANECRTAEQMVPKAELQTTPAIAAATKG